MMTELLVTSEVTKKMTRFYLSLVVVSVEKYVLIIYEGRMGDFVD